MTPKNDKQKHASSEEESNDEEESFGSVPSVEDASDGSDDDSEPSGKLSRQETFIKELLVL